MDRWALRYPRPNPSTQPTSSRQHPFFGHEQTSNLCARFITRLFACPRYPPSSSNSTVKLLHHSACLAQDQAPLLVYLCRPCPFSAPQGSVSDRSGIFETSLVCIGLHARLQGHRFISDGTYSNKLWSTVAQGMFQLREINQMEREMCQYLEYRSRHAQGVRRHNPQGLCRSRSHPTRTATDEEADAATTANPFAAPPYTSPSPSYRQRYPSPPKPLLPSQKLIHGVHDTSHRYAITFMYTLDIPSIVGVPTYPTRDRRLCRQDRQLRHHNEPPNSLDQFCINFTNYLQNFKFTQKRIFESHADEYQTEGMLCPLSALL